MAMNDDQQERQPLGVKLHPIALLSIVDHYQRTVGNKQNTRCMGVLLGEVNNNVYDITNSYAVPFDEERGEEISWFVDHDYHESMYEMFKKINLKERVLGWYVSGTTFKPQDLEINELWARYCPNPVLAVVDVRSRDPIELPTKAFFAARQITNAGIVTRLFTNIPCTIDAFEAEEVGVEHLVREIKDLNMNTLKAKLANKIASLGALNQKIDVIIAYLEAVSTGQRVADREILAALQEIMSRLPKVINENLRRCIAETNNENYLNLLLSSIVNCTVYVHSLLNNKIKAKEEAQLQQSAAKPEVEQKAVEAKSK